MRITDITKADKDARHYQKAKSILHTIQRRMDFYKRRMPHRITPTTAIKAARACQDLRKYMDGEINSSLSSREMINNPVKQTLEHIFENLPPPCKRNYTDYEIALIQQMNDTGINQRTGTHRTALSYEIAWAAKHNYFMLFNTLTVANGHMHETFAKESKIFKTYIRNFTRTLPGPKRDEKEHTYFACVEAGTQTGRLHIHVIHFFKDLPPTAQDPNLARYKPDYWEIIYFKHLWKHFSVPKMVRYNPNDAYGKLKWRWPLDRKTQLPYEIGSPQRVASYMSKYINMSYENPKREKYLWRIRKSHNLGNKILEELLSTLTPQDLLNIATNDSISAKLNRQKIPPALLRLQALKMYNYKTKNQNLQSTENHKMLLCKMVPNIASRPQPLQSSHASIHDLQTNNQQNIGITRIQTTSHGDTFEETQHKLKARAEQLNAYYFAEPTGAYGTTSTEDHLYQ